MPNYICHYCGKDTSEIDYDYLSGTDHLSCVLEAHTKNNPIEQCVSCGKDTDYRFNDRIDTRFYYVEGSGQLCRDCYNRIYKTYEGIDAEPPRFINSPRMLVAIEDTTIQYTPNDAELGAKVRQLYWEQRERQNGK